MKRVWKIAFLDWNGAFLNDVKHSHRVVTKTFNHFGLQCPEIEVFRREISGNHFLTAYRNMGLPESIGIDELSKLRIKFFGDGVKLHVGAKEFLRKCRERNIFTAFVTGEVREVFESCIQRFGINDNICHYVADVGNKRIIFQKLLNFMNYGPAEAFCIDDSPGGILAAKELGIPSIGFTKGICIESFLLDALPDFTAGSYKEISNLIFL